MGVNKNTPYNWFDTVNLPEDTLRRAAQVLNKNAAEFFPRLGNVAQQLPSNYPELAMAEEGKTSYGSPPADLRDCQAQLIMWQGRAYENLEKYTKLLHQYNTMLNHLTSQKPGGGSAPYVAHSLHNSS